MNIAQAIIRIRYPRPVALPDEPTEPPAAPIAMVGRHVPGPDCATCLGLVARGEDLRTTFEIATFFADFGYAEHFGGFTAFGPSARRR